MERGVAGHDVDEAGPDLIAVETGDPGPGEELHGFDPAQRRESEVEILDIRHRRIEDQDIGPADIAVAVDDLQFVVELVEIKPGREDEAVGAVAAVQGVVPGPTDERVVSAA